jgi:CheY-like chemotaxis protein
MITTKPTVLVVDDEKINCILARAYLERLGWDVEECDSADGALRLLSKGLPQAMLLDIRMPGMSGDELARHIRSTYPDNPITLVAYTAHCQTDELLEIRKAGFNEVLVKPVSFLQMTDALPLP